VLALDHHYTISSEAWRAVEPTRADSAEGTGSLPIAPEPGLAAHGCHGQLSRFPSLRLGFTAGAALPSGVLRPNLRRFDALLQPRGNAGL